MDDFNIERPELTGSLISMEFGPGGRIGQLWVTDPNLPEEGEEFQFVIGPINIGEEIVEDYYPGTILIGARTAPDEPWILSRNSSAEYLGDFPDPGRIRFEYEFGLLQEIRATGTYYELPGIVPQIVWEVEITNEGRTPIEIGELAFPFALNNLYEGFPRTDEGIQQLYRDRLYIHKYIGGAASYLFAQRMTAEPPGLLIYPGGDTRWEFFNHVPASLHTPYRWEGIPVVYVYSRAAIEREEWEPWFNGHTTLILEPGESKQFQTCFAPAERDRFDTVQTVMAACGRPAIRLLPSAVAPAEVGIAVEVTGATPTQFYATSEAEMETDSDEEGGFCFIRPKEPGPVNLMFEDTKGRESIMHLLFTAPIESLIKKRARWIVKNQIFREEGSNLDRAILATNIQSGLPLTDPEDYFSPFGIESSLADALFLAEKNTIYPLLEEIQALDAYIEQFLQDDVQNPGDGSIGSSFTDFKSVALSYGRTQVYPLAFSLYTAMYRIATNYGETRLQAMEYLEFAANTALAMFKHAPPEGAITGSPVYTELYYLLENLRARDLNEQADRIEELNDAFVEQVTDRRYPFSGEGLWNSNGYHEAFELARRAELTAQVELTQRLANAARSPTPSWWWYASDKRWLEQSDPSNPAIHDRGEMCLGPSTVANSAMFFRTLGQDYNHLPESYLRMAFGGMLGVWSLIRMDGAGSMGFCPDLASRQYGLNHFTGDLGLALYIYLRNTASYVLPARNAGVTTFGCHFEIQGGADGDFYVVRPWDGVGRRVVVRQLGLIVETSFGSIKEFKFNGRKRYAELVLVNPSDKELSATVCVKGLWGKTVEVDGRQIKGVDGEIEIPTRMSAAETIRLEIKVIG